MNVHDINQIEYIIDLNVWDVETPDGDYQIVNKPRLLNDILIVLQEIENEQERVR